MNSLVHVTLAVLYLSRKRKLGLTVNFLFGVSLRCFSSYQNDWLIPISNRSALFIPKGWGYSVCYSEFYVILFGAPIATINFELNPQKCL